MTNPFDEKKTNLITAEEILKASDVRYAYVPVDEWGEGKVIRLRSLSAREAQDWTGKGMVQIVIKSAVDENGKQMFTEAQMEQLKDKSFAVFNRIQEAAMTLNGMRGEGPKVVIKND